MKEKTRLQHEAELEALRARRIANWDPDLSSLEDECKKKSGKGRGKAERPP